MLWRGRAQQYRALEKDQQLPCPSAGQGHNSPEECEELSLPLPQLQLGLPHLLSAEEEKSPPRLGWRKAEGGPQPRKARGSCPAPGGAGAPPAGQASAWLGPLSRGWGKPKGRQQGQEHRSEDK